MSQRRNQCIRCQKRTTYHPERCTLIRSHRTQFDCVVKLYGIVCAQCFRKIKEDPVSLLSLTG